MFNKILVPVDGSEHAEKALRLAADLASKYDARLYLFHALLTGKIPKHVRELSDKGGREEPTSSAGFGYVDASLPPEVLEDIAEKVLTGARKTAESHGVTQIETNWRSGRGAEAIIDNAREVGAEAIVMGSRGLSDVQGMLIGSTSHKVSHQFDGTVVLVK